jgi:hypothetical protein
MVICPACILARCNAAVWSAVNGGNGGDGVRMVGAPSVSIGGGRPAGGTGEVRGAAAANPRFFRCLGAADSLSALRLTVAAGGAAPVVMVAAPSLDAVEMGTGSASASAGADAAGVSVSVVDAFAWMVGASASTADASCMRWVGEGGNKWKCRCEHHTQ